MESFTKTEVVRCCRPPSNIIFGVLRIQWYPLLGSGVIPKNESVRPCILQAPLRLMVVGSHNWSAALEVNRLLD